MFCKMVCLSFFTVFLRRNNVETRDWIKTWNGMDLCPFTVAVEDWRKRDSELRAKREEELAEAKKKAVSCAIPENANLARGPLDFLQPGSVIAEANCHILFGQSIILDEVNPLFVKKEACLVQVTPYHVVVLTHTSNFIASCQSLTSSFYIGTLTLLICFDGGNRLVLEFGDVEDRWKINTRLKPFHNLLSSLIPTPILSLILKYLPDKDLGLVSRSCRLLYYVSKPLLESRKPPFFCVWRRHGLEVHLEIEGSFTVAATRNPCALGQRLDSAFFRQTMSQSSILLENSHFSTVCRVVVSDAMSETVVWMSNELNPRANRDFEVLDDVYISAAHANDLVCGGECWLNIKSPASLDLSLDCLRVCFVSESHVATFVRVKQLKKREGKLLVFLPLAVGDQYSMFATMYETNAVIFPLPKSASTLTLHRSVAARVSAIPSCGGIRVQVQIESDEEERAPGEKDQEYWIGVFPEDGSIFLSGSSRWVVGNSMDETLRVDGKNLEVRLFKQDKMVLKSKRFNSI